MTLSATITPNVKHPAGNPPSFVAAFHAAGGAPPTPAGTHPPSSPPFTRPGVRRHRRARQAATPYAAAAPNASSSVTYGIPVASATGSQVTAPPTTLTPFASPGLARAASVTPTSARCRT